MIMNQSTEKTIGQIVAEDYRKAKVFEEFGLDFCCGGNKTIAEASAKNRVNPEEIERALQNLDDEHEDKPPYNKWPLHFLVDYIINTHHIYARDVLSEINFYSEKVLRAHGENHPELQELYYTLVKLYSKIIKHLDEEEEVVFPYVKKLVEAERNHRTPDLSGFGMVADPISMMEEEHDEAGETMARIRTLTNNFTPPTDACTTYQVLFKKLQAFEQDLHKHVHLENNILFPKALDLERKIHKNLNADLYKCTILEMTRIFRCWFILFTRRYSRKNDWVTSSMIMHR